MLHKVNKFVMKLGHCSKQQSTLVYTVQCNSDKHVKSLQFDLFTKEI